jgi:hypothetical protein
MTIVRQHVSTQWGSSSGLYKRAETICIYNIKCRIVLGQTGSRVVYSMRVDWYKYETVGKC